MHKSTLKVLMAQINPLVGDIETNLKKILRTLDQYGDHEVIIFPELALTGYPPEDLLFRKEFHQQIEQALQTLQQASKSSYVVIGHPLAQERQVFNALSVFHQNTCVGQYFKHHLPNYGVFDEKRYFTAGPLQPCILTIHGFRLGFCICEDLWQPGPMEALLQEKVHTVICINASPFDVNKYELRETLLCKYAQQGVNVVYINQVGGQDELVFDGQSLIIDRDGKRCARAKAFQEDYHSFILNENKITSVVTPELPKEALLYEALQCGLRDYVRKNKFSGVLLGLSGGIDSALVLTLAVDALGAEHVHAVLMPSRYTATMSVEDATLQANTLGVAHSLLSIEPAFKALLKTLNPSLNALGTVSTANVTTENLQARIRGMLLMALSNQSGSLLLTTSNKSETAVGYSTLYGDMAGGFAPLKDVLKTQVYQLARYRNSLGAVIPERVLTRAPSAELAPNQRDQDSLPPYEQLDAILMGFMEQNLSADMLIAQGHNAMQVARVLHLLKRNEYKRRQAAPGIKISPCAFGKDWRYPLTSGFEYC